MFETMLSAPGAIGCDILPAKDGGLLFLYSTNEGKVFKKSYDAGRSFAQEWIVPLGTVTANSNLLRLKDGRLMMPLKQKPEDPRAAKLSGADFTVVFSSDDGRSFGNEVRVNAKSGCHYLMNGRLLRARSGRILMPLCLHPEHLLDSALETAGWAGCFVSDDEGQTWREGQWLPGETVDQLAEPMVAQGPDGTLHMMARTGRGYLYRSVSTDEGLTWSQEEPTTLRSPCAPFCFVYDEASRLFLAVWDENFPAPHHQYPRSPICLGASHDGQHFWKILELDANPMHSYGYPKLFPLKEELLVAYYWNATRSFDSRINQLKLKAVSRDVLLCRP